MTKRGRTTIICKFCGQPKSFPTYLVRNGQVYCSRNCYWKDMKGKDPKHLPDLKGKPAWNKGLTKNTDKRVAKYAKNRKGKYWGKYGIKHHNWKGEKVGYVPLHLWVSRELGEPRKCEHCKTTEAVKFEWANKDHKYKRNLNDWIRLCTSCHRKYDLEKNLVRPENLPQ